MTTAERVRLTQEHAVRVPAARVRAYYESVGYRPLRLRLSRAGAAWRLAVAAEDRTPTTLWVGGSWESGWGVIRLLWDEMETSTVYIPDAVVHSARESSVAHVRCHFTGVHQTHYWSSGYRLRSHAPGRPDQILVCLCRGIHEED